jgi:ATP-dependent RNA helicase DeaD
MSVGFYFGEVMTQSFQELGLDPILLETLEQVGYTEPTPIQHEAIPHLLAGRDVLGQAQTGTGKTAAFTLPTLQQLNDDSLQVLILNPTRELAIQNAEAVYRYGHKMGLRVLPIYGGQSYDRQIRRLKKGVHVVVGTPGRTLDLIKQGALKLGNVRFLILDEADEMLKMGFIEDIEQIINATDASNRQTILFSATFSSEIRRIAKKYMRDAVHIKIESEQLTGDTINQRYYAVKDRDKINALSRILEVENPHSSLIFARTKVGCAELAEQLMLQGYPAVAIHGDLSQQERERIVGRFKSGKSKILVATDVMARGVDIPAVSHVINYDLPQLAIEYVHRIGRTGRAGRTGEAITLVTPRQRHSLKIIERYIDNKIDRATLPTREQVLEIRQKQFTARLVEQIEASTHDHGELLEELAEMGYSTEQVASALIGILRQQEAQESLAEISEVSAKGNSRRDRNRDRGNRSNRGDRREGGGGRSRGRRKSGGKEKGMVRLIMPVGKSNGVRPGDVVYKIASNAEIPGHVIGHIDIQNNKTFVDVPEEHVEAVLKNGKNATIKGQSMKLKLA